MAGLAIDDDVSRELERLADLHGTTKKELAAEIFKRSLGALALKEQQHQIINFLQNFDVEPDVESALTGLLNRMLLKQGTLTLGKIAAMQKILNEVEK